jgi:hypothetical protein
MPKHTQGARLGELQPRRHDMISSGCSQAYTSVADIMSPLTCVVSMLCGSSPDPHSMETKQVKGYIMSATAVCLAAAHQSGKVGPVLSTATALP